MSEFKSKQVFIAYSGEVGAKIAKKLQGAIRFVFQEDHEVDVFVAAAEKNLGDYQDRIEQALLNSKCFLLVATQDDSDSGWNMYETGIYKASSILQPSKVNPNTHIYAFGVDPARLPKPLFKNDAHRYYYNDSEGNFGSEDEKRLFSLFLSLRDNLGCSIDDASIHYKLTKKWEQDLKNHFANYEKELLSGGYLSNRENSARTTANLHIDTTVFKTKGQLAYYSPFNVGQEKYTPATLEKYFEMLLDFLPSNNGWKKFDEKYDAHRVIVGKNTRISTFVAFTDGKNILLFDRSKAGDGQTSVFNNKWDVFGSVQFENRSIKAKIFSEDFMKAPIQELKPIYGAAFEDNSGHNDTNKQEVAVMFGVFAFMSERDLSLALQDNRYGNLCIMNVDKANNIPDEDLTSKAYLSIKQLSDLPKG